MTKSRLPFEDTFTKEQLATVGLLTVSAANSEAGLFFQALRFHGPKPPTAAIQTLSGQELRVRLQGIRNMTEMRCGKQPSEKVRKATENVQKAFERRHLFAHAMICAAPTKSGTLLVMTPKVGATFPQAQEWRLEQIVEAAAAIHQSVVDLEDCLTEIGIPLLPPPSD